MAAALFHGKVAILGIPSEAQRGVPCYVAVLGVVTAGGVRTVSGQVARRLETWRMRLDSEADVSVEVCESLEEEGCP